MAEALLGREGERPVSDEAEPHERAEEFALAKQSRRDRERNVRRQRSECLRKLLCRANAEWLEV